MRTWMRLWLVLVCLGAVQGVAAQETADARLIGRDILHRIKLHFSDALRQHGSQRILDMSKLCKTFALAGKTRLQANRILRAAGQGFDLIADGGPASKPGELVGGFVLENDGFAYSAVFNIRLRASGPRHEKIEEVVYCNVLTRSL